MALNLAVREIEEGRLTHLVELGNWPINSRSNRQPIGNEIHIWHISLPKSASLMNQCRGYLSSWEQRKVMSYPFLRDREDFILQRGLLRKIVSRYQAIRAKDVVFSSSKYGKLLIEKVKGENLNNDANGFSNDPSDGFNENSIGGEDTLNLQASISCSGDEVVFALADEREVGIDLEYKDPGIDLWTQARQSLTVDEYEELQNMPADQKIESLYRAITLKQAVKKVTGYGRQLDDRGIGVKMNIKEAAGLREASSYEKSGTKNNIDPDQYFVTSLDFLDHYSCSIAVNGPAREELKIFQISY